MMQFKVKIFQQEKEGVFIQASERPWWNCCVCAVCRSFVRKVHLRNNKGKEEVLIAPLKVKLLLLLLLYAAPPLLCWASVCRLFIYKCIPREEGMPSCYSSMQENVPWVLRFVREKVNVEGISNTFSTEQCLVLPYRSLLPNWQLNQHWLWNKNACGFGQ